MLRHTLRTLLRAPVFALATIVTLAIALGATTAIFSVVDGVLLEPLPFPQSDRLVAVRHLMPTLDDDDHDASAALYLTYRDHNTTFESVALWFPNAATVTGGGEPEEVQVVRATGDFLPTLRVRPLLGREFSAADDTRGSPPTVMLSHAYWQSRFGGARDAVGRTLTVDGAPHEIIGVLPPAFRFLEEQAEVLLPAQLVRTEVFAAGIGERAIARLKDGATLEQANADVARMIPIAYDTFRLPGARQPLETGLRPGLRLLKDRVVGDLDDVLLVLMSTIGMLLLIACANIANLLLVRTEGRRQELAIRAALGAGWAAIARSLLIESALLALAGGAAGLMLASVALPVLLRFAGSALPSALAIDIGADVALFTVGVSLLCGALLCTIPIAKHAAPRVVDALRGVARSYSAGRETHRARNSLIVAQVGFALVLLIAAGLMIRSFVALRTVDPGVLDPAHVQTLRIALPTAKIPDFAAVVRRQNEIADRLAQIPGVESVAYSTRRPLFVSGPSGPFVFDDRPEVPAIESEFRYNSPGYFETLGTPLVAGRDFEWADTYENRAVAIVSANLATTVWGSPAEAIGKSLRRPNPNATPFTVVGVAGDIRHDGVDRRAPESVYLTQSEFGARFTARTVFYFVRSDRVGAPGFVDEVHRAVWAIDPELPLGAVEPLGALYERSMARTSLTLVLLAITASMAITLGLVGIYAVIAYVLTQRTREIGIRMALGAQARALKGMLLRQMLGLIAIGVALGVGGAAALTRLMDSLLFGVTALDPLTYAIGSGALLAVALLAGYLPARRVTRVDPMQSLRAE